MPPDDADTHSLACLGQLLPQLPDHCLGGLALGQQQGDQQPPRDASAGSQVVDIDGHQIVPQSLGGKGYGIGFGD